MAALPPGPLSSAFSGGDSPGSNPLTIGGVTFNSIEAPPELTIGAVEQKLATIEEIGGGRVVQPLGVQPKDIEFKGTLYGQTVEGRIQQLRSYVVSALPQTLTYLTEKWTVVVEDFTPTYKGGPWVCDYSIKLRVVTGAALTSTSFPTVSSQVDGNNTAIQSALASLQSQADSSAYNLLLAAWQAYLIALGILYETEQVYF